MRVVVFKSLWLLVVAVGLLLSACGGTGTPDPGPGDVTVSSVEITNVPSPAQVQIGATVDLNATVSGSSGVSQDVTWSSSDASLATVNADGVVTGVSAGSVNITATSDADSSKSDQVTLQVVAASASCLDAVALEGPIAVDTVLPLGCHLVEDVIKVNAQLTVTAGATLVFATDAGLSIDAEGAIVANGTAAAPITFTSAAATPAAGDWKGIFINSNSNANSLINVTVSYGSGENYCCGQADEANVYVNNGGRLTLSDSTLSNSQDYGFYSEDGATITVDNITYTNNTQGDMSVASNQLGSIDQTTASTYAGIAEARASVVADNQTWKASIPYRFTDVTDLRNATASADVTIEAGATLKFATDAGISVEGGGSLKADGEAAVITFTSAASAPAAGDWKGIFITSNSNNNLLNNTVVSYAAGENYCCGQADEANVYVDRAGRLTLINSTLSNSEDYGFYSEDGSTISLDGNTYSGNTQGDMSVASNQLGSIDQTTASTYAGVAEARASVVATNQTWKASIPYRFTDVTDFRNSTASADVTIEAGATLKFATDAGISVEDGGSLKASNVTFTSSSSGPAAGDWRGIFITSNSNNNVLSNVTVSYGGGANYCCGQADEANVYVDRGGRLTMTGSTLSNSEDYGVYVEADATVNADICTANTFSANTQGECLIN